jgi:hypothetical protein
MESQVYTRRDLMDVFQCSYTHARRIYNEIYVEIPEKERKKIFKTRLPKHYVEQHLNKK